MEPVAGNPLGGFYEGGQAQAASTARPVPTHHSISHHHLRAFLDLRVTDGVIRRMIDKWLKAGVIEGGQLRQSTEGSPQGGVITPLTQKVILNLRG